MFFFHILLLILLLLLIILFYYDLGLVMEVIRYCENCLYFHNLVTSRIYIFLSNSCL